MNNNEKLQDVFLNRAHEERVDLTIYLINGFQFKGIVRCFDDNALILECEGKQNLIYKHAISAIIPSKTINFINNQNA